MKTNYVEIAFHKHISRWSWRRYELDVKTIKGVHRFAFYFVFSKLWPELHIRLNKFESVINILGFALFLKYNNDMNEML